MIEEVEKQYKIRNNRIVIYIDGFKKKEGISTGCAIWMEGKEEGYYLSIEKNAQS